MTDMTIDRRRLLASGAVGASLLALPQALLAQARIPQHLSARVIVDNDFAGDPDGLVALAHQLLSPRTPVPLVTVSGLNSEFRPPEERDASSVEPGVAIAQEMLDRMGLEERPAIVAGREPGHSDNPDTPAARAIVAEAMREHDLPLVFTCGGPLSNLADALRLEPAIASRMSVIWIGGGAYPDGAWEYNLSADVEATRLVIEGSTMPISQIPQPAYRLMQVSVAEMETDMEPISDFTRWLYSRFTDIPDFVDIPGAWPMGDSPLVLLTAMSGESSHYLDLPARRIADDLTYGEVIEGRTVRVYDDLDLRLTWADFIARLRLHAMEPARG